jgi:endonuclease YncB( thermonuclease family)
MRLIPFRGRFPRQRSHWVLIVAGFLVATRLWGWLRSSAREFDFQARGPYHVVQVDEAGTLHLDGEIRLRLFGIDIALDKGPVARQAVEFVRGRVAGRDVTLEFDRQRKDLQGHLLAYVYSDGTLLNEELIRAGLARPDTGADVDRSMATRFRHADDEARDTSRGIWELPTVSTR